MKYLIIFAIALLCVNTVHVERQGRLGPSGQQQPRPQRLVFEQPEGQVEEQRPQRPRPQGQVEEQRPQRPRPQGQAVLVEQQRPQRPRPQGQAVLLEEQRPQRPRPQGQAVLVEEQRPQRPRPQGQAENQRLVKGRLRERHPEGGQSLVSRRPQQGQRPRPQGQDGQQQPEQPQNGTEDHPQQSRRGPQPQNGTEDHPQQDDEEQGPRPQGQDGQQQPEQQDDEDREDRDLELHPEDRERLQRRAEELLQDGELETVLVSRQRVPENQRLVKGRLRERHPQGGQSLVSRRPQQGQRPRPQGQDGLETVLVSDSQRRQGGLRRQGGFY